MEATDLGRRYLYKKGRITVDLVLYPEGLQTFQFFFQVQFYREQFTWIPL